ncbi:tRNA (cytosine-5-)-methyltransferase ncl1 [Linderina macrospora]|uniref:tRNA (Cytosine-5-)-methyltransferase ncl1 n=1 Tax=Linderina macrospora TaxID=4868 RepID=A0ACC1JF44_9FUNG|nr:tRNA (cytosine-5-)-methyltransferase ncl1 [Linderina macrospora]
MARGKGRRNPKWKNGSNKTQGGQHVDGERRVYKSFSELRRDNDSFRKYYTAQKIVPEDEFPQLIEAMRTVLPTSFRITGSRQQGSDIREQIEKEFVPFIQQTSIDGEAIEPPHVLPWYPNRFGWQFTIPRVALKKSTELSKFHSFLVTETEVGNISRQEAVSMVPPLFLDVQPSHYVLDMCAAPGSKTAQLIEALHADTAEGECPAGVVVANDADYKRACMLVHQVSRLNSPSVVVTNHSGERFPNIYDGKDVVQFDRILCDVPCSGDGTTRKNVRVWEKWRADDGHSLNPVQTKILQRAAYLLKTGGRLVYSTCSLNPIENEAVVANVLSHFEGALQLVDVSEQLPELKRRPGLDTWKVMTRDGNLYDRFEEIPAGEHGRNRRKYSPKLFPLPAEEMEALHMERCMRIYSHLQNTGGFFVAVIEKVKPITVNEKRKAERDAEAYAAAMAQAREEGDAEAAAAEAEAAEGSAKRAASETPSEADATKRPKVDETDDGTESAMTGNDDESAAAGVSKRVYLPDEPRADPALMENPFVFLESTTAELASIIEFYGIRPTMSQRGFLSRIEKGSFRSVYYVSETVRKLMTLAGPRLRIVNTGIRVFSRNAVRDAHCAFRLVCEGTPQVLPHLSSRFVVDASFHDLKTLLSEINPLLNLLSPETQKKIEDVPVSSSVIVRYDPKMHEDDEEKPATRLTATLALPCWRGKASLSVHMDKHQLRSLIQRVLGRTVDRKEELGYKMSNNRRSNVEAAKAAETPEATEAAEATEAPEATETAETTEAETAE